LKALYHNFTMPAGSSTIHPITHDVAASLAQPPDGVERSLWLYELCRFLTMKVNNLIIAFFAEDPPCSQQSCPEMRASEWQYLCAVHDPPKSCCAIDYCCHTLDWATNILTSPKYFPSRLTLGSESAGGPQASMRHLTNIFRRLYRIFAHAWFQHRDVFRQVENTDGLYIFFKTVCDAYGLIPPDNYTVPDEAEQSADNTDDDTTTQPTPVSVAPENNRRISVLRKDPMPSLSLEEPSSLPAPSNISTGATTRRHKHSPSTGSSVTTIAEANEDNGDKHALAKVEENEDKAVASENPEDPEEPDSPEDKPESPSEEKPEEVSQQEPEQVSEQEPEQSQEQDESQEPEAPAEQEQEAQEKEPEVVLESIEPAHSPTDTVIAASASDEQPDEKLPNGDLGEPDSPVIVEAPFDSTTVSVVETGEKDD
jgi:Mob1/phocein family